MTLKLTTQCDHSTATLGRSTASDDTNLSWDALVPHHDGLDSHYHLGEDSMQLPQQVVCISCPESN